MSLIHNTFSSGAVLNRIQMYEMETSVSEHIHGQSSVTNLYAGIWSSTKPNSPGNIGHLFNIPVDIGGSLPLFTLSNSGTPKFSIDACGNVCSKTSIRMSRYMGTTGVQSLTVSTSYKQFNFINTDTSTPYFLPHDRLGEANYTSDYVSIVDSGIYLISAFCNIDMNFHIKVALGVNSSFITEVTKGGGGSFGSIGISAIRKSIPTDKFYVVIWHNRTDAGLALQSPTLHMVRVV